MKTLKINKLIVLLLAFVAIYSCVEDDEFRTPDTTLQEPNLEVPVISVDNLVSLYEQEFLDYIDDQGLDPNNSFDQETIAALKEDFVISLENTDNYVSGYVISNDEAGNFFKELIIQNKANSGDLGLRVMIDVNPLFGRYGFGQLVYVKLVGMHLGNSNGVLTLGITEELEKIARPNEEDFIKRSAQIEEIVPNEISFSEINETLENVYVQFNNVQFNQSQAVGDNILTFAGESGDVFDGERTLESCSESGSTIILSTSTFADFKSLSLPSGQGSIKGVLTRDFFGEVFNLVINSPEDINFGSIENRCDPVFEESFTNITDNTILDLTGWINYAESGSVSWMEDIYEGNGYARFSAYNSNDNSNIGWLITPAIDLDAQIGEILTFETQHAYPDSGHDPLSLLISTDFDGTEAGIATATWTELSFDVSYVVDYSSWFTFTSSGNVDISGYTSTAYIAFRYTGSDTANQNMTLDIDNIKVFVP